MANVCWYQIRVKGEKKDAYMIYYTMAEYERKSIVLESGSNDKYTIIFEGDCKWSLDAYCEKSRDDEKIDVTQFISDNGTLLKDVTNYYYYTLKDKSKIFNCEIEAFAEYEDYCVSDNSGDIPTFEHYKNGSVIDKFDLPYNEMKNKMEELFGRSDIMFEYEEDDDWYEIFSETSESYESGENSSVNEENVSIFPFRVELYNTQLDGGAERAEKYQIGDEVKLKCIKEDYGYNIRVEHELGFVGCFYEMTDCAKKIQEQINNMNLRARIAEVEPLSKRSKRCKKPLVFIEVYLKD